MKRKTKKRLISALSMALVISLNMGTVANIAGVLSDSGLFGRLSNLSNNLIYLSQNGWTFDTHADGGGTTTTTTSCSCSFSCDADEAVATLMGSGSDGKVGMVDLKNALNTIDGHVDGIEGSLTTINTSIGDVETALGTTGALYTKLSEIKANTDKLIELQTQTNKLLGSILTEIQAGHHKYRVAHVYSLNNTWDNALWRPYSADCPYIKDITTVQGKYANVYMGYWDTSVTDVQYTTATKINELGQTVLDPELLRAYEVLGYDIIRVAEGAVTGPVVVVSVEDKLFTYSQFLDDYVFEKVAKDDGTLEYKFYRKTETGEKGEKVVAHFQVPLVFYSQDIGTDQVSWLDAVTVLYRALGKEEIQYTSYTVADPSITPETSPTSQGLSGVTTFDGYNHFVFQTRANVIKEATEVPGEYVIDYTYWDRARKDGFVAQGLDMNTKITFEDFCVLAEDMMTAYGEPTISKDELKALLQVYGSDFPIQLGTETADAWAYLMVRGILIDPTINCTDTITRSELLKMAAAIKDDSFRTDFKNIQITLDLADVMQEDGYYPVKDFEFTQNQMSVSTTYDYSQMANYTYLIPIDPEVPIDLVGAPMVYKSKELKDENLMEGIKDTVKRVNVAGNDYYRVTIPKTYLGNIYIGTKVTKMPSDLKNIEKDKEIWYVIPSSCLGGGLYAEYKSDKDANGNITTTIGYSNWHEFDYRSADKVLITYADWKRSGESKKPEPTQVAYGLTGVDKILAYADLLTSPIIVHADDAEETQYKTPTQVKFTLNYKDKTITMPGTTGVTFDRDKMHLGVDAFDERAGFTNRGTITSNKYDDSNHKYVYEYDAFPADDDGTTVGSNLVFAGNAQMRILDRMATWTDFCCDKWLQNKGSVKECITSMLKCEDITGFPYKDVKYVTVLGIDSKVDAAYGRVWIDYDIDKIYGKKLVKYNMSMLPYLFLTGSVSPRYTTIEECTEPDWKKSGVLQLSDWLLSYNDYIQISTSDSNAALNQILLENIDNMYTKEENDMINKWRTNYGTTAVEYGCGVKGTAPTEYSDMTYWITTKHPKGILADLGKLSSSDSQDSNYSNSGTYNLTSSMASSAIMNRDQQVLISWEDLTKCGFIKDNDGNKLPTIYDDGTYRFMTKNGQVIVNDLEKTIQIGSTLYDLQYSSGESPTLVYFDTEQEMVYFDYRCVLGVVSEKFQRTGTTTTFLDNCIGAGKYAIYDFGDGNAKANSYTSIDILARNISSTTSYDIRLANNIMDFDGSKTALGNTYGDGLIDNGRRMVTASFIPTANWVTCIDDNGTEKTGACYVYYPAVAFTEGYINSDGLGTTKPDLSSIMDKWKDVVDVVNEANAIKPKDNQPTLKSALESTYGISVDLLDPNNEEHRPLIMTYYAIAKLYEKTGSYYFTDSWYVREFDITNNAWFQANSNNNMSDSADVDGNAIGIMYWVDSVGYVYNLPDKSQFTWKKYFEGEYMLPLISDASNVNTQTTEVLNLNLDFYGQANTDPDSNSRIIPYGGYLTNTGFVYVECVDGEGIKNLDHSMDGLVASNLKGQASTSNTGSLDFPIRMDANTNPVKSGNLKSIPAAFTPAPSGIYVFFAKNAYETWLVSKLSNFIVDANRVYYGSSQLSLQPKSINSDETTFKFAGADMWNAISINNSILMYRVHIANNVSTLIIQPTNIRQASASGVNNVEISDMATNPIDDWLSKIGAKDLLKSIDEGASFIIIFTFEVIPIIGIILMMILVGLAFLADVKIIQKLADKFIDPVKILTFGRSDIHHWHWQKVLFPCIVMFLAFALFLNGNLIMLVQSLAKWYGVVSEWVQQVL